MAAKGSGLAGLVGRRLLVLPISLLVLATLSFCLVALLPGNPAVTIAGNFASESEVARIEADLGLDRPFLQQYGDYMVDTLQGDLGHSLFTGQSVGSELTRRLPATIELVLLSLVVAAVIGLVLGTIGAYAPRTPYDRVSRGLVTLFQSIPDFLLAVVLVYLFYYRWGVAPEPVGQLGLVADSVNQVTGFMLVDTLLAGRPDLFMSHVGHLVLPVIALGVVYSTFFGKLARSVMATAFASPQVEFARACGLSERKVVGYALLQGRASILTYGAILFGSLIGGAAIIETVFAWQGAGQWALEAILKLDIPVIQAFILVTGLMTIVIYLLLDVLVAVLDPRVRYE
jgi:peptide/nickel transport system permease protein